MVALLWPISKLSDLRTSMGWNRTPPHEMPVDRPVAGPKPKKKRQRETLRQVNAELRISREELRRRMMANTLKLTGQEVI
jgi:hypothetical protein